MIDMSTKSNDSAILLTFGLIKNSLSGYAVELYKPMGLGTLQAGIVRRLGELGTTSLAELARRMNLDPAAIGRASDTLIEKGWVRRVDHPTDRRRWEISLSAHGRKQLAGVWDKYEKLAARLSGPL